MKAKRKYRNPVIFAKELHDEMVRDCLSRKQLAERHGVSSDRITQWLCLLKLPEDVLTKIVLLGDYWDRQVYTERELRRKGRSLEYVGPEQSFIISKNIEGDQNS